ncbi:MAG: aldo/keto reductase family protein [Armatimonadetes bacterium]|nr:aldo/keto reductase family protein [Armatimonadota bacterium]
MEYRQLGKYGVKVSEVALGGWLPRGKSKEDSTTEALVYRAFDLGINFFDVADVYNKGEAEKSLAKAIAGMKREDLFIATKCYFPMSDRPNDQGLSRKHIHESVHNSLKRLGLDYVDLFQFHRFDDSVPMEEMVRAVDDLIRQGKMLYWGVSEWPAWAIVDLCHTARACGCAPPVSNQPRYSMLTRQIEAEVLPACERMGMGQVVFSPLAQGVLTGKYLPDQAPPAKSRGADDTANMFMDALLTSEVLTKVQRLAAFTKEQGIEVGQFALAWCLRQKGVSSVIVGATKVEHIEQNAAASELKVDDDAWQKADEILGFEA